MQLLRVARPLGDLLRKGQHFVWNDAKQQAFKTLKRILTTAPVLGFPNFVEAITLAIDPSGTGLGAVLMQRFDGNLLRAHASRSLS